MPQTSWELYHRFLFLVGNAVFLCISHPWGLWFAFAFPPCIKEGSFAHGPHLCVSKLRTAILEHLLWHDSSILSLYENSWAVRFFGNWGYFAALSSINSTVSRLAQQEGAGPISWGRWNGTISSSLSLSLYIYLYICISVFFATLWNEINKKQQSKQLVHCLLHFHDGEWVIKTGIG